MDNVPVHVNATTSKGRQAINPLAAVHRNNLRDNSPRFIKWVIAAVIVLALLALGGFLLFRTSTGATIDEGKYQAVFFTNGQVYFGKLHQVNASYFKLTDVFYIQSKDNSSNPQQTTDNQTSGLQLIKLGSEVHGPEDEMVISKDQVLFFENLKPDGTVSKSITTYENKKK